MTPKELAERIDGIEYPAREIEEGPAAFAVMAKEAGLVIAYGSSDDPLRLNDLLRLAGAVSEEFGAWNGTTAAAWKGGPAITAEWCPDGDKEDNRGDGPCWRISGPPESAAFKIMEDGEVFCEGIVFYGPERAKRERGDEVTAAGAPFSPPGSFAPAPILGDLISKADEITVPTAATDERPFYLAYETAYKGAAEVNVGVKRSEEEDSRAVPGRRRGHGRIPAAGRPAEEGRRGMSAMAYRSFKDCGCIRFVAVDLPEMAEENAEAIREEIRDGWHVERVTVEEVRAGRWGKCESHATEKGGAA